MDLINILFVLLFTLIGGIFAASEMAFVSLRESQIEEMAKNSKAGAAVKRLTEDSNRFLSAVQIGVTIAGFFSASFGAAQIAPSVAPLLQDAGMGPSAASTTAFILVTIVIAYISIVFGELVPKRIAMQSAQSLALLVVYPLSGITFILRPVIWFLGVSVNFVLRLVGRDPKEQREVMGAAELRAFVAGQESIAAQERTMVVDMLSVGDRSVQEIMTPRTEVEFFSADTPIQAAQQEIAKLGHSRYPVREGNSDDDVVGFIHIRDLLNPSQDVTTVGDLVRPIMFFPTGKLVLAAMTELRAAHEHLAVIVDEYGGTDGIITLEDAVEEFVGEIRDEYDRESPKFIKRGDSRDVDGLAGRAEVVKILGIDLPEGPFDTLAGFVVDELGRMPQIGDAVEWGGFRFTVQSMDSRRIEWLRVQELVPADTDEAETNAENQQ
ncbi:MAG: hemolysin family protein [Ancrocorticia sp.]|uniref:hemolysin family protein n=1 Tax=Ancrocorticia sp. TaxID=2593684 RepID=UPI003F8FF50F